MLDSNDKKWVKDTVCESETRLRAEMQGMETRLRAEMQDMETRLRVEMQDMETRLKLLMENQFDRYYRLVKEFIPDAGQSYHEIKDKQRDLQDEISVLQGVTKDHSRRISKLEKAVT